MASYVLGYLGWGNMHRVLRFFFPARTFLYARDTLACRAGDATIRKADSPEGYRWSCSSTRHPHWLDRRNPRTREPRSSAHLLSARARPHQRRPTATMATATATTGGTFEASVDLNEDLLFLLGLLLGCSGLGLGGNESRLLKTNPTSFSPCPRSTQSHPRPSWSQARRP